jgi:3-keto-5-aminohexanoate cleavage enzyme
VGGACLLGRWSGSEGRWLGDRRVELFSSYAELASALQLFSASGVRPELEIYHAGMLQSVRALLASGALAPPLLINFVLGIPGEVTPCEIRELLHLAESLPPDSRWLATAIGARHHFRLLGAVVALGGHVRVGLEDNLYLGRGILASSNGQLVAKAVRILRDLGAEPASPAEARELWGLAPGSLAPRPALAREVGA